MLQEGGSGAPGCTIHHPPPWPRKPAQNVDPGRGSVLTKSQLQGSHGGPVQARSHFLEIPIFGRDYNISNGKLFCVFSK